MTAPATPDPLVRAAPDGTRVDAPDEASVSFAPPEGGGRDHQAGTTVERDAVVAVGPGRSIFGMPIRSLRNARTVSGFPVQIAKVQPPPLRDDVLSRPRLNSWLDARVTRKVVLVIAEAGYGKTTLLADWTRTTTRRTIWYRLDTDDRDWLTFLTHLVASGRQLEPAFGEESQELIGSLGPGGPTRDTIVASLVRELSELAADGGLTLVFDDFHAVDESDDIVAIVRALVERSSPSLSFLFASRQQVPLPLARHRSSGQVAELRPSDLRFDELEIGELASRAGDDVPEDILMEVGSRTEGWPAALLLALASIHQRSGFADVKSFVGRLAAERDDLHAFLAEEVVARLPGDLQRFLARAAILEELTTQALTVANESIAPLEVIDLVRRAADRGLLQAVDEVRYRFHPLVREFMSERLKAEVGAAGVAALHDHLARSFDGSDWRIAAVHFAAAGRRDDVMRVIEESVDSILGRGEYATAERLLGAAEIETVATTILRSRVMSQRGLADQAIEAAHAAVTFAESEKPQSLAVALFNLVAVGINMGRPPHEFAAAYERLAALELPGPQRRRLVALRLMASLAGGGSLANAVPELEAVAAEQEKDGETYYLGITHLNLATILSWLGDQRAALRSAASAERLLRTTNSGFELTSVFAARLRAEAIEGEERAIAATLGQLLDTGHATSYMEAVCEAAEILAWYGDEATAVSLLELLQRLDPAVAFEEFRRTSLVNLGARVGNAEAVEEGLTWLVSHSQRFFDATAIFRRAFAIVRGAIAMGRPDRTALVEALHRIAQRQEAPVQVAMADLAGASSQSAAALDRALLRLAERHRHVVSALAELVLPHADAVSASAQAIIAEQARVRRARWMPTLRRVIAQKGHGSSFAAALLAEIGDQDDVALLHAAEKGSRRTGAATLAVALARRHAPHVWVEDLGRVTIDVGPRQIDSGSIRRKVAALVCLLLSRPGASATREQVLDALWPDFDPSTSNNSLNQTLYFLRRLFEPEYREAVSPGYVRFDGDVIWLDGDLVDSRSRRFARAVLDGDLATAADLYVAQFAADFAYDDWASAYRDNLHASYLSAVERLAGDHVARGDNSAAIAVLQRAMLIDPEADAIEARLLKVYLESGSPAAAAEQYGHYVASMRDALGVDAPQLEDV